MICWHAEAVPPEERDVHLRSWNSESRNDLFVDYESDDERIAMFLMVIAAADAGFRFLRRAQRPDGSWLPLWFGNQHAPDDVNPTYGTARVLAAFRDAGLAGDPASKRGVTWLLANQNDDGGWGGMRGTPSSVEETALAVEVLCDFAPEDGGTRRGVGWLIRAVEDGSYREPSPIGFYFAKLWYFERLYPLVFTVAALRAARCGLKLGAAAGHDSAASPANGTSLKPRDRSPSAS